MEKTKTIRGLRLHLEVTVTVTSQLSPSDAEKLKNWIASQTELPVSLTIQMETSPSSYFGNGINWNGN